MSDDAKLRIPTITKTQRNEPLKACCYELIDTGSSLLKSKLMEVMESLPAKTIISVDELMAKVSSLEEMDAAKFEAIFLSTLIQVTSRERG